MSKTKCPSLDKPLCCRPHSGLAFCRYSHRHACHRRCGHSKDVRVKIVRLDYLYLIVLNELTAKSQLPHHIYVVKRVEAKLTKVR